MANFPSSPTTGFKVTLGSTVYEYTGVAWKAKGSVPSSPAWSSSPEEASLDGHAAFKKQSVPSATEDYAKVYSRLDESGEYTPDAEILLHFNDNLVDSSGGGNDASLIGGTPTYAVSTAGGSRNNATFGKAVDFNGSTSVSFPDFGIGTGDFTIETFVNWDNANSGVNMCLGYGGTAAGPGFFQLHRYQTVWYVAFWDHTLGTPAVSYPLSWDDTANAETLVNNTWYHVAVVREGSDYSFYKDGVRKVHLTGHAIAYTVGGGDTWALGRVGNATSYMLNGKLDEFYVSKVAKYSDATYTVPTAPYAAKTNLYAMDSVGNETKLTP